jgi:protein gp37
MAANSNIEWTTHTFNPWRGCTKVSPGCAHCYADTLSKRNPGTLGVCGPNGKRVVAAEAAWKEPLKWDRLAKEAGERHRVFCASLADVFEDWTGRMCDSQGRVLWWDNDDRTICATTDENDGAYRNTATMDDFRNRLFRLIDETPNLDWLLLTKRPQNIIRMMPCRTRPEEWPRKNIWLGVSVEDQARADERIPLLLKTPAAVRFLSCEPLLGPVDLTRLWLKDKTGFWNGLDGRLTCKVVTDNEQEVWAETEKPITPRIEWVIVGGESGHDARPLKEYWVRSLVHQCKYAGVAVFVKQLGHVVGLDNEIGPPAERISIGHYRHNRDKKGGDPSEWPEDLRVREFPVGR